MITAIKKQNQSKVNKWSRLQESYRLTVNEINIAEDSGNDKKADRLRIKEEKIYSDILDVEEILTKFELKNCKKEFKNNYGYEA